MEIPALQPERAVQPRDSASDRRNSAGFWISAIPHTPEFLDDNQHAPDENLRIANLRYALDLYAALLTMPPRIVP